MFLHVHVMVTLTYICCSIALNFSMCTLGILVSVTSKLTTICVCVTVIVKLVHPIYVGLPLGC